WNLYPAAPAMTYPAFVEQIKQDWNANFPIRGPMSFIDVNSFTPLSSVQSLQSYLAWKNIKIMMMSPWLDYDPGSISYVPTRQQYKDMMLPAIATIRQADPSILVFGNIETDWVNFNPDSIPNGSQLPHYNGSNTGGNELTTSQTAIVD